MAFDFVVFLINYLLLIERGKILERLKGKERKGKLSLSLSLSLSYLNFLEQKRLR
ncbi:MAG: hypothetical protein N7Q72_02315 [Spiroplasma sp. Tabriz.8]|nr:hypothetical protein [Spiroplasma sp. Tabriz.8]